MTRKMVYAIMMFTIVSIILIISLFIAQFDRTVNGVAWGVGELTALLIAFVAHDLTEKGRNDD